MAFDRGCPNSSICSQAATSSPSIFEFKIPMLPSSFGRKLYQLSRDCKSMSHLKQLLTQIIQTDASNHPSSLAALLSFSATSPHGDLHFASLLFSQLPNPTPFAYNSMIQSLINSHLPHQAFLLYLHMTRNNSPPDKFTYPFLLKACSLLLAVTAGKSLHSKILQLGLSDDSYIQSSLVRMYSQFDDIETARNLFDGIIEKDIVLWNSMIGGYVKCGELDSAQELFEEMPVKNIGTYNAMLGGYAKLGRIDKASKFFEEMPKRDIVSWNTIIGAHARFGSAVIAHELFDCAPHKNVTTWSTIVSGFCQSSRFADALNVFKNMLVDGPRPNQAILVSVLSSCAHLGALEQGIWVHAYIDRLGFEVDDWLGSSLVDMYSKCGLLRGAELVFDQLNKREACAWTSMIYGLAIHGHCQEALATFDEMEGLGIRPNDVTFVAVLCACSHAGLVEKGREIFDKMHRVYAMSPKIEHYTCMVDLLSRANQLKEARELIGSMPIEADVSVWGALLGGYRIHGRKGLMYEDELGEEIARLKPMDSGAYVLMSNVYAALDRWGDAERMRGIMEGLGVRKNPGCSLIEVEGVVHEFLASGRLNAELQQVYEMLDLIHI